MTAVEPWFRHCRTIYAIGRNYAAHAAELNNPIPKSPFWFIKPFSSLVDASVDSEDAVHKPFPGREESHHELELGVMIKQTVNAATVAEYYGVPDPTNPIKLTGVGESNFLNHCVAGFFVGLDMTDREGQAVVKKEGKPWTQAKGWDTSCPVGRMKPLAEFQQKFKDEGFDWRDLKLKLKVNGEIKQEINQKDEDPENVILVGVAELIAAVARVHTLHSGDLVLTGTPKGVGAVRKGDVLEAGIEGFPECDLKVKVGCSLSSAL